MIETWKKTVPMTSIKTAYDKKVELEDEATRVWEDLARELEGRIPNSCRKYAECKSWFERSVLNTSWKLPDWLLRLVEKTKKGEVTSEFVSSIDRAYYGFRNTKELVSGMQELEDAWGGLIRFEVRANGCVNIYYTANEFVPTVE